MSIEWDSVAYARMLAKCQGNIESLKQQIYQRLSYIGEMAVKTARELGNYEDHTGNLRSSIGYMVVIDGEIANIGGQEAVQGQDGSLGLEGVIQSQMKLEQLAGELPQKGAVLVLSAGMHYAYYVENLYHRDVLASAEIKATQLAKKLLKFEK